MENEVEQPLLQEKITKLEKEIENLKKKQVELNDIAHRYKRSPFDVCYLKIRKLKKSKYMKKALDIFNQGRRRIISILKKNHVIYSFYSKLKKYSRRNNSISTAPVNILNFKYPTITVVIPTYKPTKYLKLAVESILQQEYEKEKIKILIIVNGENVEYFNDLQKVYKEEINVTVVYTEKKGVGAARNSAKKYLDTEYVTYLDDDDYFTSGYLKEMAQYTNKEIDVVCGRLVDLKNKWELSTNTYINNTLRNMGGMKHKDYTKIESLFSSFNMKLYKKELITDVLGDFDENLSHTEDVLFWVKNIGKISGDIYTCKANSVEAYVRRVTENSLSRPDDSRKFAFYITDRVALIEEFEKEIYNDQNDTKHKMFVLHKITTNLETMNKFFSTLSEEAQQKARTVINASESCFINKALFAERKGIAFCHNFSPAVDASAFVASKRLAQISSHIGEPIGWSVICSDMSNCRKQDMQWEEFYARFQYVKKYITKGQTAFNEEAQYKWAKEALAIAETKIVDAEYIYSRSMWAGSHVAAYLYKKNHPDVKWYAEFSDPIYMGTDNKVRKPEHNYSGEKSFFNTFWKDVEEAVLQNADAVIFTNENQRRYMLKNNVQENEEEILSKTIVWNHPIINNSYVNIMKTDVFINSEKINVGYFGTFYPNRDYEAMLTLLKDKRLDVYMFTNITEDLRGLEKKYSNLHVYSMITQLEFLNLASRMDYCYLNDIKFDGEINPYLPSKLADYLAANSKVLALTYVNSPMDKYNDNRIYKVHKIDDDILKTLNKRLLIDEKNNACIWDTP